MRLSAPKKTTFWIAIVFCVLGVLGGILKIAFLEKYALFFMLVSIVVLVLGCCVKDF